VIVFYKDDIEPVTERIERHLQYIEEKEIAPESHWEFGYFGRHLILALPKDVIPQEVDIKNVPHFFELQIKTLFQDAWSEANHDLGYKPLTQLDQYQLRRLAFTAAQAWGADQVFQDL
jgi:putative GTP pyrophosphokinase